MRAGQTVLVTGRVGGTRGRPAAMTRAGELQLRCRGKRHGGGGELAPKGPQD